MGFDLIGHGDINVTWSGWIVYMDLALAFGWQPVGTARPTSCKGEWNGSYCSNDFQRVTAPDAFAFGTGLERASSASEAGHQLTAAQTDAFGRLQGPELTPAQANVLARFQEAQAKAVERSQDSDFLLDLAEFAKRGSFLLG